MDRNYPPDVSVDDFLKESGTNESKTPQNSSPRKPTSQDQQGAGSVPRDHGGYALDEETCQQNSADQNEQNEKKPTIPSFLHPTAASQRRTAKAVARTPATTQRPAWNGGSTRGTIRTPTTPFLPSTRSPTRRTARRPPVDLQAVFGAPIFDEEVNTGFGVASSIASDISSHLSPGVRAQVDGPISGIALANSGRVQADPQPQVAERVFTQPPLTITNVFAAPIVQDVIDTGFDTASGSHSMRPLITNVAVNGRPPVSSNTFFNTPSVQETFRALMNAPAVDIDLTLATTNSRRTTVASNGPVDPLIRFANGDDIFGSGIETAPASRYPLWFDDESTVIYNSDIDLNPTPVPEPPSIQLPSSNYVDAGTQHGAGTYVSVESQPTGSPYIDVGTQTVGMGVTLAERYAVERVEFEAQMRRHLVGILIEQMEAQIRDRWGEADVAAFTRPAQERVEVVMTNEERGGEFVAEAETAVRGAAAAAVVAAHEVAAKAVAARPSTPEAQRDAHDFIPSTPWAPFERFDSSSPLLRTNPPTHLGPVIPYPSSPAVVESPTSAAPVMAEAPLPATVTESTLFGIPPAATSGEGTALLGSPPTAIFDEVFAEIMDELLGLAPGVGPATPLASGSLRGNGLRNLAPVTGFVRRMLRSAPRSGRSSGSGRRVCFASIDKIAIYEDSTAGEFEMSDSDENTIGVFGVLGRRLGGGGDDDGGGFGDDNKENIAP